MAPPLSLPFFFVDRFELFGILPMEPFGAMVALGFLTASLVAQFYARKRGMDPLPYSDLLVWMAVAGITSAHLGHVAYQPAVYLEDPLRLFRIWDGLSSFGAFFGCAAVAIYFFKRRAIPVLRGGDVMLIGVACGVFVGRIGCFVVHDHVGTEVQDSPRIAQVLLGPLAIEYPDAARAMAEGRTAVESGADGADDVYEEALDRGDSYCCPDDTAPGRCPCSDDLALQLAGAWAGHYPARAIGTIRYDLGLMDSLLALFVFGVLVALARKPRREGFLLAMAPLLYAPIRLLWDGLRNTDLGGDLEDVRYLGLTPGQIGALVMIGLGLWALKLSRDRPLWPDPGTRPWTDPKKKR